ncbi:MAG: hypothetical protein HKO64_10635 [Xanthomonadales bacterium]|nr:hypothetical protein [Gammaproteobacteria bacterium]NNE04692.1 hypothetical protein [Xanthomonadales bacterium]NNL96065.1 hypothetical protein [Xanthomonadales bacterium]
MIRILTILAAGLLCACDTSHDAMIVDGNIQSKAVSGAIAPDTLYRGSLVATSNGICGLVLIEAGQFAEDASIRFNTSFDPPGFEAADGIRADCIAGQVSFIDLVTGQSHTSAAPDSLDAADAFTRSHIEILLL